MSKIKDAPKRIFLQLGDDCDCISWREVTRVHDMENVTWCEDMIDENDIEYVLATQLKEAIEQINDTMDDLIRAGEKLKEANEDAERLADALEKAREHLDYCGYGDDWERSCAREEKLPQVIDQAITKHQERMGSDGVKKETS